MNNTTHIVKEFIPPVCLRLLRACRGCNGDGKAPFVGNFSSWEEASAKSVGYDSELIVNKVKDAVLKVKSGQAGYERDSVIFDKIIYSFPVLAGLLLAALAKRGSLSVIDFGGSLGSSYFQCRGFLKDLKKLLWSVVEQPQFVDCGKKFLEDDELKFYYTIEECIACEEPDVILLSSVIQYLSSPNCFINDVIGRGFDYIIIDRTPFLRGCRIVPRLSPDLLTIQIVPPSIYDASYPAWFFDEDKFLGHFRGRYKVLADFDSFESWRTVNFTAQNRGYIFEKIRE
jgi:putative methyltransferase (TIGR04325 family)